MTYTKALTFTIIAGLFALVFWTAFGWLMYTLAHEQDMLRLYRAERSDVYTRDKHDTALRFLVRDTKDRRDKLNSIVGDLDAVEIIRLLEDVSSEVGAVVSVDAVNTAESDDVYDSLIVALRAEGAFANMAHTLTLLDTLQAATAVDQFEIDKSSDDTNTWRLTVRERVFVDDGNSL